MSQRSRGISVTTSSPSRSRRQKAAGSLAPPGNRQAIPTIAIGSGVGGAARWPIICANNARLLSESWASRVSRVMEKAGKREDRGAHEVWLLKNRGLSGPPQTGHHSPAGGFRTFPGPVAEGDRHGNFLGDCSSAVEVGTGVSGILAAAAPPLPR